MPWPSAEAAIALALVLMLFERKGHLDIAMWQELRESNQPPFEEEPLPPERGDEPAHWPQLTPSGVLPESVAEKDSYRRKV